MASPSQQRRLRSATSRESELEELVEAVVTRLTAAGLTGGASGGAGDDSAPAVVKTEAGADSGLPSSRMQDLWIKELRDQLNVSPNYGTREKQEVRALLIIGEGAGPPEEQQAWYWGRVRLFLIVAHHGWSAAVSDARTSEMDRLGIRLQPAVASASAAPRAAPAPPPPDQQWRGRPSRPSGLRPRKGGAAWTAAPRRKD